jgi:hypothetical protein
MKLTKRKLKQLILEVLKEAKSELSILQRLNRYAKATGQTTLGDDFEQFKKMYKTNPKYKALAYKQFVKTLAWEEEKGLSKFASDEKPQAQQTKTPAPTHAPAAKKQAERERAMVAADKPQPATYDKKLDHSVDDTRTKARMGSAAHIKARTKSKDSNDWRVARRKAYQLYDTLVAQGWNPKTGINGIKNEGQRAEWEELIGNLK